jgi:uroporphyrinogen decarboxylase
MTHKERVIAALNHKEPDRVPIDLLGSASRITNDLYFEIIKYLGLDSYSEKVRPGKTAEYSDYRICEKVDSDFRHAVIGSPYEKRGYVDDSGLIFDEWGIGYKMIAGLPQMVFHPLANATYEEIGKYKGPIVRDPGRLRGLEIVKKWYDENEYYIVASSPCSGVVYDFCYYLRGLEKFLMDMASGSKSAARLIDMVTDIIIEFYEYYLTPIADYVGWVEFQSDFASQQQLMFSPDMFRKYLKKPYKKIFDAVKKIAPDAKIFLHSCGAVRQLIPDLIDIGVDILNSLQPKAKGMNSFELKSEFGNELILHGGLDMQGALSGTREEAINEAKERITAFAPNGGYIFSSSNHFMGDTPVENFFAVFKTANTFGKYPIKT